MQMKRGKSLLQTGFMDYGTLWGANASLPELPALDKAILGIVSLSAKA
jgi:hypothetical protein